MRQETIADRGDAPAWNDDQVFELIDNVSEGQPYEVVALTGVGEFASSTVAQVKLIQGPSPISLHLHAST
jgi:hypothetical protein